MLQCILALFCVVVAAIGASSLTAMVFGYNRPAIAFLAWINHMFLNLGGALGCVFYAIVPPHLTNHTEGELLDLASSNPVRAFLLGLGLIEE